MADAIGLILLIGFGWCVVSSIYRKGKAEGSRKGYHVGRSRRKRK